MTTFFECVDEAVSGELLTRKEGKRLKEDYRRFREAHRNNAAGSADQLAKQDLLADLDAQRKHKRRQAKLAYDSAIRIDADARSHKTPAGKTDLGAAFLDMLEHFGTAAFSSVAGRQRAITGMAHARMETLLHHFRRGALRGDKGRHNAADLKNVLRESFGTDTGDTSAREFANAWMLTAEWLRQRFNAAGGAIGKLDNWGLPQWHDPRALRKAGLVAWKAAIRPLLDTTRMRHPLTGAAVEEKEMSGILDEVFATIATEGWSSRKPSRQAFGRGALANQRAEHRFLVFRDPEAWLEYQENFGGGGDVFSAMMGHINMMAKDIAAIEVLGPNPQGTIEWMKQSLTKEAEEIAAGKKSGTLGSATGADALDRAASYSNRLDAVWGSIRGTLETPVNSKWANWLSAARSLITASVLGQAAISSISDIGTSMIARNFAGLPAGSAIPEIIKGFGTYTQRQAVQAGLILDSAMNVFHAQARYVGTLGGPEWASYIADRVLTFSGLTPWTQAARHAFGLAFQVEAGNNIGRALKEMPDALQKTFRRYGISDADWEKMRQMPLHEGHLLRPMEIAERIDPKLAEKYLEMVQTETEYAVPNGSHRSRTTLLDQNQPGTFIGEVLRSFAQFKSFGAVFVLLHGQRIHGMISGGERAAGAAYAGSLLLSTTVFGAAALQLKQIAAGRDPRDVTTADFWGAALLQGGGLGIYGDFLFSNVNRYGGGFSTTLAGPLVQRANDFWNLTAGNVIQLASGEKTNFGRELVKFARGNIPGGNIWYLRLAWERTVLDQVQFLVDPEANNAFKRQQQFWKREFGQQYWWKPGEMTPGG
jgi:hypothetical protein